MSDVGAMTKTAEERAREIVRGKMLRDDSYLIRVIADALRQTERAVWLSAAEVADTMRRAAQELEAEADDKLEASYGELAWKVAGRISQTLRRRAEEV